MDAYYGNKLHYCVVAIGDPGLLGDFSLKSIVDTSPLKVCALVDDLGAAWIEKFKVQNAGTICVHFIKDSYSWVLKDFKTETTFQDFGSDKFFRLMFLKWVILEECLSEIDINEYLIFSDLDVFWSKSLANQLEEFSKSSALLALQNDSTETREFYCPGIMIWKQSSATIELLRDIRDFHLNALSSEPLLPDDKAINRWLCTDENKKFLYALPKEKFVIGHRIFQLLREVEGFDLQELIAYHANYTLGSKLKLKRLIAVSQTRRYKSVRIYSFCRIMIPHFFQKIRKILA